MPCTWQEGRRLDADREGVAECAESFNPRAEGSYCGLQTLWSARLVWQHLCTGRGRER